MYKKISIVSLWTLVLVLEGSHRGNAEKYPAVIIFGDSIADAGNNNDLPSLAKCNFPPYGKDFPGRIPTGRWTNGKTSSDFIDDEMEEKFTIAFTAQQLGIKEVLPAYNNPKLGQEDLLTGVNFASGGSGYDPLTSKLETAISLPQQLTMFKEYKEKVIKSIGEDGANDLISKAFYGIVSSSNDIASLYYGTHIRQIRSDFPSYADFLVGKASEFVQELYAAGARQINVFGAPPLGCLPFTRTIAGGIHRHCNEEYNNASQAFNTKLNSLLPSLNATLPGANLRYVDIYQPLLQVIQNYQHYGFRVADRGCCGTGNVELWVLCNKLTPTCTNTADHVFWDSYHPSERAYQVLVSIVFENVHI